MRNRASIRRRRRETQNHTTDLSIDDDQHGDLVHDAENTTNMLSIQGLVERARHASREVQKGIIQAGLQRHLYPFEPRQKQIDAIWHLVFKKEDLLLAAKISFGPEIAAGEWYPSTNTIYEEFSKADSKIRIMVAIESIGTGVDLSDVKRVVQYSFPLDRLLSVLIQRFGRAARMAGIKGEAIFLVESWAIGDRITLIRRAMFPSNQTSSALSRPYGTSRLARLYSAEAGVDGDIPDEESDVAIGEVDCGIAEEPCRRKTESERRTDLYNDFPALFNLVNRSTYLRRILMDWLQENLSDPASRLPALEPDECCNGDNAVNSANQKMKPQISIRLFTQKSEWISLSTEYAKIRSTIELKEFVKSTWLKDHFDELFKVFNDIKSYIVRNWPGGSRLGTAAAVKVPISQERRESAERRSSLSAEFQRLRERRTSLERQAPVEVEYPTPQ
ncbi:hypothetical protein DL98DRAFT_541306 [Cadophora sp. DSE1049]|nr:hypothetical protein DL98DRAFT_541306 [Cadophora sp. DSE1049]